MTTPSPGLDVDRVLRKTYHSKASQMSFSLKSNLSYSGLSADVEGAATSAYNRVRSYMEEMMGLPVALAVSLMVLVLSTPVGKTPGRRFNTHLNHDGLGASEEAAAIDNYHRLRAFMDDALYDLAADVTVDLTMTARPVLELPSAILDASAAEEGIMKAKQEMEAVMKHKLQVLEDEHAEVLAKIQQAHKKEMEKQQRQDNAKYAECLAPLIDVRDKMRAECDKKCEDARRRGHAMGQAFADQKWNPVYKEVCEELAAARNELSGWAKRCVASAAETAAATAGEAAEFEVVEGLRKELVAARGEAEKLQGEVDSATVLFQAMRSDLERLNAENKEMELAALILSKKLAEETASSKALREEAEEDKQMVQRHLKEIAKENAEMTAWEKEEIERLRGENKDLQKKNAGLRDLVGPTITHMKSNPELFGGEAATAWRPVSEEETVRAETFLKGLEDKESPSPKPPAITRTTEGLCMALTEEQYKEMFGLPADLVPDEPKVCGAAGCIECPAAEAKPKPNYNHPNWPSPITKRFAKHLAKHSGLRRSQDPNAIRTHQDALEYIAKRSNISVETLLQWTMKHYQSFSEPWTLVEGPSKFHMGPAPATWW